MILDYSNLLGNGQKGLQTEFEGYLWEGDVHRYQRFAQHRAYHVNDLR